MLDANYLGRKLIDSCRKTTSGRFPPRAVTAPTHGAAARRQKRIFVTLGKGLSYFISLVYTEHGLALGTAFPPDGEWLRKMQASSTLLGP